MGCERILLVDNDPVACAGVADALSAEGYRLTTVSDGPGALSAAKEIHPDIIILNTALPRLSGVEVCRLIRRDSRVPIIILSNKTEEDDRIIGFESGADDYVTKPFGMRELISRIRAALRRTRMSQNSTTAHIVQAAGVRLDALRRVVIVRGKNVSLTPKEFELLRRLMYHPNRVVERRALFDDVWGKDSKARKRTLDVHICWLRQKIEVDPNNPKLIITTRGIGYRFAIG